MGGGGARGASQLCGSALGPRPWGLCKDSRPGVRLGFLPRSGAVLCVCAVLVYYIGERTQRCCSVACGSLKSLEELGRPSAAEGLLDSPSQRGR
eukprot:10777126-Alexandrium_andersonii.AAC.1